MINGLPITQSILPQTGGDSAPVSGAQSGGDSDFLALFGGMLISPSASLSGTTVRTGPGAALGGLSTGLGYGNITQKISAYAPNQSDPQDPVTAALIRQLLAQGFSQLNISLNPNNLSQDQQKALTEAGVTLGQGSQTLSLLVDPKALADLKAQAAAGREDGSIPVALIVPTDSGNRLIQAALSASAVQDAADMTTVSFSLQIDPTNLIPGKALDVALSSQATGNTTDNTNNNTSQITAGPDQIFRLLFEKLAALFGNGAAGQDGLSQATDGASLPEGLMTAFGQTSQDKRANSAGSDLQSMINDLIARLQATDKVTPDASNVSAATDSAAVAEDKSGQGAEALAALLIITGVLAAALSDSKETAPNTGAADAGKLLKQLAALDNLPDADRRAGLASLLEKLTAHTTETKPGAGNPSSGGIAALLQLLAKAGDGSSASDAAQPSSTDVNAIDSDSQVSTPSDLAISALYTGLSGPDQSGAAAVESVTQEAPAVRNDASVTDKSTVTAALDMLRNLIQLLNQNAGQESGTSGVAKAANQDPSSRTDTAPGQADNSEPQAASPILSAAQGLFDLLRNMESAGDSNDLKQALSVAEGRNPLAGNIPAVDSGLLRTAGQNDAAAKLQVTDNIESATKQNALSGTGQAVTDQSAGKNSAASVSRQESPAQKPDIPAEVNTSKPTQAQTGTAPNSNSPTDRVALSTRSDAQKISLPVELSDASDSSGLKSSGTQRQQAVSAYAVQSGTDKPAFLTENSTASRPAGTVAQGLNSQVESLSSAFKDKHSGTGNGDDSPQKALLQRLDLEAGRDNVKNSTAPHLASAKGADSASARTLTLANQAEVVSKMASTARLTSAGGTSEIKIKLEPENLGFMRVHLTVDDSHTVSARIQVQSHEARSLIEGSLQKLKDSLGEQGLRVDKFSVDVRQDQGQQNPQHQQQFAMNSRGEGDWRSRARYLSGRENSSDSGIQTAEAIQTQAARSYGYNTLEWVA